MLTSREVAQRINVSRHTWARAVAEAASRLGVEGETYRDTGDAYAVYAGPDSPFNVSWGDYYPACTESIARLYEGRSRCWSAIPSIVRAVNFLFHAGGRATAEERVLYRWLTDVPSPVEPNGVSIEYAQGLCPWAEVIINGIHGNWSDAPSTEEYGVVAQVEGVRRYVAFREGEAIGVASMFTSGRVAYLLLFTTPGAGESDVEGALIARLLHDALDEADLAWIENDDDVFEAKLATAGFQVAFSQLVFDVPVR